MNKINIFTFRKVEPPPPPKKKGLLLVTFFKVTKTGLVLGPTRQFLGSTTISRFFIVPHMQVCFIVFVGFFFLKKMLYILSKLILTHHWMKFCYAFFWHNLLLFFLLERRKGGKNHQTINSRL